MKYLLILCFLIQSAFAIDVTPIEKGAPAPEKGFFITAEALKEMRAINERKKLLEKENIQLKDLAVLNEARIENYKKLAEETQAQLRIEKTKGTFKGVGGFALGVLATSVAAYAAIKATR
jgi:hypothetical protein